MRLFPSNCVLEQTLQIFEKIQKYQHASNVKFILKFNEKLPGMQKSRKICPQSGEKLIKAETKLIKILELSGKDIKQVLQQCSLYSKNKSSDMKNIEES